MSATFTAANRESIRPAVAGVLYAEDFDDEPMVDGATADPAPEPEFIEPTFTAEELEQARAEGKAAGRAEAERGLIASRLQMLSTIASEMTAARESAEADAESLAEMMARCILGALKACLPSLCNRHGAAEVAAVSRVVLPLLVDEPRITVRVHPHMIPVLTEEVGALDFEIAERVKLVPVETMAPGDLRINWQDGVAKRDTGSAIAAIDDALTQLGLLEPSTLQPEIGNA
jgi:flagellar assembly protein FliH